MQWRQAVHRKRASTFARGRVEQQNSGKDELLEIVVSYDSWYW